jgi:exopolyphosphatase/guanosine-5'-triphosphate,3'-diphosphate pyrophosphatase
LLVVDIGGGSTELIRAEPGAPLDFASLQIGSVRLTERIITSDPPNDAELRAVARAADEALAGLRWNFRPEYTVGIAGTVTTICAVTLGRATYDRAAVHGRELSRAQVRQTLRRLASLPLAERKKLPGLPEGRADVIVAGAVILDRIMEQFESGSVVVSDQGVRWGLAWRELERSAGEL